MKTGLVEALGVEGLTCVVGAGGKKTTLYRLAGVVPRAVVTATVRIPHFDSQVSAAHVTDDPIEAVRSTDEWPVGVVPERESNRYRGYDPTVVDDLAAAEVADVVLVKADGARTRWLKAPNEREPRIPASADVVIPIASARIVGEPLSEEHVHRPDRVAALTGRETGESLTAADVATVLTSDRGGLKGVPADARVVPLVNMVDDEALQSVGREIAEAVLARIGTEGSRVVLAQMIADDPVVAIVE